MKIEIYEGMRFLPNQMEQIRYGLQKGINVSLYADPKYRPFQMEQIRLGLEQGLDVSIYLDDRLSAIDMDKIRRELLEKKNPKKKNAIIEKNDGQFEFDLEDREEI